MLHGGVCRRTSTPDKSGNTMKEKKKLDSKGHSLIWFFDISLASTSCLLRQKNGLNRV